MSLRLIPPFAIACMLLSATTMAGTLPELLATSPEPARATELGLFTPLLGHWDYTYRFHGAAGEVTEQGTGTWDFTWILAGRSIQDVQSFRTTDGRLNELGTTLRIPQEHGTWRAIWDGPMRGNVCELIAKADAMGIVMDGRCNDDPAPERWMFRDIGTASFEWRGYRSDDQGRHWILEEEISARRHNSV
ncbi:MAG: hypothetical protein ACHQAU_02485 [Gammaproteobacteria bacterium]